MSIPLAIPASPQVVRSNRCELCKHYFRNSQKDMPECRRFPPVGQILMANGKPAPVAFYPPTQPNQWCGEFTINIAAAN